VFAATSTPPEEKQEEQGGRETVAPPRGRHRNNEVGVLLGYCALQHDQSLRRSRKQFNSDRLWTAKARGATLRRAAVWV
jgi:hypothetical protein